jgi:hypothetical protein
MLKANVAAEDALANPVLSGVDAGGSRSVPIHGVVAALSHDWTQLPAGRLENRIRAKTVPIENSVTQMESWPKRIMGGKAGMGSGVCDP